MSSYTAYDLEESLGEIYRSDVARVIAAWGDSPEGWGSWEGGFLLALKDGRYAYIKGWCDTSGWGCRDGREVEFFDVEPPRASLTDWSWDTPQSVPAADWDEEPIDLNRYIRGEIDAF